MLRKILYKFISAVIAVTSLPLWASDIKDDEYIQLMPGAAKLMDDGSVECNITAWVYEKEMRPGAQTALALWMKLDLDSLSSEEKQRFKDRTQLFRIDSERNKKLTLAIQSRKINLPLTDAWGLTQKKVKLNLQSVIHGDSIPIQAVLPSTDNRVFAENLKLVSEEGLSIISDIDDTIKDSHVLDKQLLLRNTFVKSLHAVAGMSEWYQSLAVKHQKMAFHYVSSSPLQLYPLLMDFLQQEKFPAGSLHLRSIKLKDELFQEGSSSQRHKKTQIRQLLEAFPKRKFILIGDSGESDPEIYAAIAREYPESIQGIAIRNVTNEARESDRYQKTFLHIPEEKWLIFSQPQEIQFSP